MFLSCWRCCESVVYGFFGLAGSHGLSYLKNMLKVLRNNGLCVFRVGGFWTRFTQIIPGIFLSDGVVLLLLVSQLKTEEARRRGQTCGIALNNGSIIRATCPAH